MAFTAFLKNILGGTEDSVTLSDNPENVGKARNENLSGRAFKKQLAEVSNSILLDVRTAGEFSSGTIPGALHVDFLSPNFAKNVGQLDKDATYFLFCRSGNRSGQACKTMHKMGFDVRNLSGGIGEYPF
jgi:rhodanese-related sulfurtransferase